MLSDARGVEGRMVIKLPLTRQKCYLNALNMSSLNSRNYRQKSFVNSFDEKFFLLKSPTVIEDAKIMTAIHKAAVIATKSSCSKNSDSNNCGHPDEKLSSRPKTTLGLVNFAAPLFVGQNSQLLADSFSQSNQQLPASSFDSTKVTLRDILVNKNDNEARLRPQSRGQPNDKRLTTSKPTFNLNGNNAPISPNSISTSASLTSPLNFIKGGNDAQPSNSGNIVNFSLSFDIRGLRPADSPAQNRMAGSVTANTFGPVSSRPLRFTRGSIMGVTGNNLLHESENMIAMGTLISPSQIVGTFNNRNPALSDTNGAANFSYGIKNSMFGRGKALFTNGFSNIKQNVSLSERYSYTDPLPSGLASFNQRLSELSFLEQETIRWERTRNARRKRATKPEV